MVHFVEASVSKDLFSRYVTIQREGKYNMIMDAAEVIKLLKCTKEQYREIIDNYSELSKKYGISY